jgi:hypothetical protein
MCAQCMAGAVTAIGAASGTRAFLACRRYSWLTRGRLKAITIALVMAAVVAAATLL